MITAQDIREKTFEKSRMNGYDMASVDDFLEELAEDVSAAQKENAEISEKIPSLLESGKLYRLSEIKALVPELASASGTQRIAVICRKLEAEGSLVKTVDKRVIYYSLAE